MQAVNRSQGELERLSRETSETTLLCTFANEKQDIVYIDSCESLQSLRFSIEIGTQRPLYCSAGGRAMLAFQPEAWQRDYLRHTKLERVTPKVPRSLLFSS